jgi:hypothetical protein
MPTFYAEDINIDVNEFLSACNSREIQELIDALIHDGHIEKPREKSNENMSAGEQIFEHKLSKLHGMWNRLSKEDEETIVKIADKF